MKNEDNVKKIIFPIKKNFLSFKLSFLHRLFCFYNSLNKFFSTRALLDFEWWSHSIRERTPLSVIKNNNIVVNICSGIWRCSKSSPFTEISSKELLAAYYGPDDPGSRFLSTMHISMLCTPWWSWHPPTSSLYVLNITRFKPVVQDRKHPASIHLKAKVLSSKIQSTGYWGPTFPHIARPFSFIS